ncbi:GPI inositol-deacylase [Halotydeus destructor]|nr:GPI inositol-deacylase [Halotydeus destructor]
MAEGNRGRQWLLKLTTVSKKNLLLYSITFVIAIGSYRFAGKHRDNKCEMTYMYQYPEYIPITVDDVDSKYPKYGLYVYGEGVYAQQLKSGIYNGIPVLFIPGNAGSYEQVRSLASVAQRMSEGDLHLVQFNYFAVDFNEELSGIYGGVLQSQKDFVVEAVKAIVKLYESKPERPPLIVIGHSVGGVIARTLLSLQESSGIEVDLIITLASPHKSPVAAIDPTIVGFYEQIELTSSNTTLLSINGGFNDILVNPSLTELTTSDSNESNYFAVTSTAIPDVWLTMDHLCIVWCRQFVLKVNRLVFDLTHLISKKQLTSRLTADILEYHLLNAYRGKNYPSHVIPKTLNFPSNAGQWTEFVRKSQRLYKPRILEAHFVLIKLVPETTVFVTVDGEVKLDWISACNVTGVIRKNNKNLKHCSSGINLSQNTRIFPGSLTAIDRLGRTKNVHKKVLKQTADSLLTAGYSHISVWLAPNSGPVSLITDRYATGKRNRALVLPSILQSLTISLSYTTFLTIPVTEEAAFFNMSLIGVSQVWHTYSIRIKVTSCYDKVSGSGSGILHFYVPWSHQDVYIKIPSVKGSRVETTLKLAVPKQDPKDNRDPVMNLILDPDCGYTFDIRLSFYTMVAQLLRYYYPLLFPYICSILIMILSHQVVLEEELQVEVSDELKELMKANRKISVLSNYVTRNTADVLRKNILLNMMYGLLPICPIFVVSVFKMALPETWKISRLVLTSDISSLTLLQATCLRVVLFLGAYSLCHSLATLKQLIVKLVSLVFTQSMPKQSPSSQRPLVLPVFAALFVLLITMATSSGIGLIAAIVIHAIQMLVYDVHCEKLKKRKGLTISSTASRVHVTIMMLLLAALVPTVPLAIHWFKSGHELFKVVQHPISDSFTVDVQLFPIILLVYPLFQIWRRKVIAFHERDVQTTIMKWSLWLIALISAAVGHNYFLVTWLIALCLNLVVVLNASVKLPLDSKNKHD